MTFYHYFDRFSFQTDIISFVGPAGADSNRIPIDHESLRRHIRIRPSIAVLPVSISVPKDVNQIIAGENIFHRVWLRLGYDLFIEDIPIVCLEDRDVNVSFGLIRIVEDTAGNLGPGFFQATSVTSRPMLMCRD